LIVSGLCWVEAGHGIEKVEWWMDCINKEDKDSNKSLVERSMKIHTDRSGVLA